MTRKERVVLAITHRETDIVPYEIELTQQAFERTARFLCDDRFMDRVGNHIETAYYAGEPVQIAPGYFRDDFGVVWNRTGADKDIGVIEGLQIPEPSLAGYRFPSVPEAMLRRRCEQALASAGDRFTVASLGFSLFERAWTLTGMENLLAYMLTDGNFVHCLMERITDFNLAVLDIFLDYGFDGIYFGDDWGQQRGLIMGPPLWREFIKPYLGRMYGKVKANGLYIAQHSCGDIHEVFPDVIELGLDVYQTFQPEIYDIRSVKKEFGNSLSFWGGISTQRLLPFESPEGVAQKAAEIMKFMRSGGGYIAAPTHAVPGDVPPENIVALIELFENQGKYLTT
ncbi:MAG: uroporphyrinogen decarboxylase [Clostridia bacterium]|nr:uroporphyrinogen decarboxylase [Clostridia bacterium]